MLKIPIMNSYLPSNTKKKANSNKLKGSKNTEETNHINNFCICLLNASESGLWKMVLIPKGLF